MRLPDDEPDIRDRINILPTLDAIFSTLIVFIRLRCRSWEMGMEDC